MTTSPIQENDEKLRKAMHEQMMARFDRMRYRLENTNTLVAGFANVISSLTDALGEFGALIPLGEIIVTIFAFSTGDMMELYGFKVLIGLVFAQIAALYLTAHYKNIALSAIGEASVFSSILVGAANTTLAIYLVLNAGLVPSWVLLFPALSSGLAVLFIYGAKMFTQERVSHRMILRQKADDEVRELKRVARATREKNTHLDSMQTSQLKLQADTMRQMSDDDLIKAGYALVMREQAVKTMLETFGVNPNTKVAKMLREQVVRANEAALENGAVVPGAVRPDALNNSQPVDLIDLFQGNANRPN